MVFKYFILTEMHFKANLFFPIMTHPNPPTSHPWDYRDGDTKRGEGGLIRVPKQVDFKIHFGDLKYFFPVKGAGWVGPDPYGKIHYYFFCFGNHP